MKLLADLIQILLSSGPPGWAALTILLLQVGKTLGRVFSLSMKGLWLALDEAKKWVIRLAGWGLVKNLLKAAVLYLAFSAFSSEISDRIQWVEQMAFNPIYLAPLENDTSSEALAAYTRKAQKFLGPDEHTLFLKRTADIAARCGSTSLSFFEVYESECGCNPFAVNARPIFDRQGRLIRVDTVAAGQIQFTAAGVDGLMVGGEAVTMRSVKDAIRSRRLSWLMDVEQVYMARASGGHPLPKPCDVYTAVFMPAFVGGGPGTVLASVNSSRPDFYYQNIGLDGWKLSESGKILNLQSARDGKITVNDLALCLAAKKAAVMGLR